MQVQKPGMQEDLNELERTLRARSFWGGKGLIGSILLPIVAGAVVDFAKPDFLTVENDKEARIEKHEGGVRTLLTELEEQKGNDVLVYFESNSDGLLSRQEQSIGHMIINQRKQISEISVEPDRIVPMENRLKLFGASLLGVVLLAGLASFRRGTLTARQLQQNAKLAGDYGSAGTDAVRELEEKILGRPWSDRLSPA